MLPSCKHLSMAKIADTNDYKKSRPEKSPVKIIISVGTNDLSSAKQTANDIIHLLNQLKLTQT